MIVYDVQCANAHRFEGWFADAAAFDEQRGKRLIACPYCADTAVERALSVPRIGSRSSSEVAPADIARKLAAMQTEMLKGSQWVGDGFATRARAMAEGAEPQATIHGQTTLGEAKALHDDGIKVMPLPFPVIPPESRN